MLLDCWINEQNPVGVTLFTSPTCHENLPEGRYRPITKAQRRTQATVRLNSGALILGHAIITHTHTHTHTKCFA